MKCLRDKSLFTSGIFNSASEHSQHDRLPTVVIIQGPFLPIPALAGGAVEKLWHRLGQELAALGHEVTHISKIYPGLAQQETVFGVIYQRVPSFERPKNLILNYVHDLQYSWRAVKCIKGADIVVTNSFFAPILVRLFTSAKVYVSVHRFPRRQYWLYKGADRYQCVSSSVAQELVRQTPSAKEKTKVIPNFVNRPNFYDNRAYDAPKSTRRILYVGRLHPEKGLSLLINAFKLLRRDLLSQWELHIVGPSEIAGGGGGPDYLMELIELAGSTEAKVIFHPPTYVEAELSDYYANADLFVYPSLAKRGEAFGLAPLEAMAHGVPAIVSNLACFEDFVSEELNGWIFDAFAPTAVQNLTLKIEAGISALNHRRETLACAAKATAESFSPHFVGKLLSVDFIELCQK